MIARKLSLLTLAVCSFGCEQDGNRELLSSRSYQGHESDADANDLVTVYPAALGTRIDDCHTCHRGDTFTTGDDSIYVDTCDFCHLIQHPQDQYVFNEPQPASYADTLNPYGAAYAAAGRNLKALRTIRDQDSDADGFSNDEEIRDLKYPGDPASLPGQPVAPRQTFTLNQLQQMATHTEFLLANSSKQQFDDYASYAGVRMVDLLTAAGVDLGDEAISGVSVIAPDGYVKTFSREEAINQFPNGLFYAGLDDLGVAECNLVSYPDVLPSGLVDGGEIADAQWLMLGYEHDGLAMQPVNLDPSSGRINGEGPLRLVVPQTVPGSPDRGSRFSPSTCNDGWDYDSTKDHNAGAMVRGVIAVRVDPLPEGYEDFDHKNDGWPLVHLQSVIVYGHGITE